MVDELHLAQEHHLHGDYDPIRQGAWGLVHGNQARPTSLAAE